MTPEEEIVHKLFGSLVPFFSITPRDIIFKSIGMFSCAVFTGLLQLEDKETSEFSAELERYISTLSHKYLLISLNKAEED